jgi:hypothetical protein
MDFANRTDAIEIELDETLAELTPHADPFAAEDAPNVLENVSEWKAPESKTAGPARGFMTKLRS